MLSKRIAVECEGCISYIWLRHSDYPRKFLLLEQWLNKESMNAYLDWLVTILGPRPEEGRFNFLPDTLTKFFETLEISRYEIVK